MGWVTLAQRKLTLRAEIAQSEYDSLQLSREKRQIQRHLATEQSLFNHKRQDELAEARSELDASNKERAGIKVGSDAYTNWYNENRVLQDNYNTAKEDIENYYDDVATQLEEEANAREERIQEQLDELEVQRQDMQAEFDAIKDQIKTEIQNQAISF